MAETRVFSVPATALFYQCGGCIREKFFSARNAARSRSAAKQIYNGYYKVQRCNSCSFWTRECVKTGGPGGGGPIQGGPSRSCANVPSLGEGVEGRQLCCCDCNGPSYSVNVSLDNTFTNPTKPLSGEVTIQSATESVGISSYNINGADVKDNTDISTAVPNANFFHTPPVKQNSIIRGQLQAVIIDHWYNMSTQSLELYAIEILQRRSLFRLVQLNWHPPTYFFLTPTQQNFIRTYIENELLKAGRVITMEQILDKKSRDFLSKNSFSGSYRKGNNPTTATATFTMSNYTMQRIEVGGLKYIKLSWSQISDRKGDTYVEHDIVSSQSKNKAIYARANIQATSDQYVET